MVVLILVAAIAAIWWLLGHKGWGAVQKVVFWVVLVGVVWVVVNFYVPPHPGGLGALAPTGSRVPLDLHRNQRSVIPCEGSGNRTGARRVP